MQLSAPSTEAPSVYAHTALYSARVRAAGVPSSADAQRTCAAAPPPSRAAAVAAARHKLGPEARLCVLQLVTGIKNAQLLGPGSGS